MPRTLNQGSKWIRKDRRLAIYLRDGAACVYCQRTPAMGAVLTLDHLTPCNATTKPDNGTGNLVTACRSCNSSRQDMPLRQWYAVLREAGRDVPRIQAAIRRSKRRNLARYRVEARSILASIDGPTGALGLVAADGAS